MSISTKFLSYSLCCLTPTYTYALTEEYATNLLEPQSQHPTSDISIEVALQTIAAVAQPNQQLGSVKFNANDLQNIPNRKDSLTDLLQVHPNVQFSQSEQSAENVTEIAPAAISINGSLPYSNQIVIDGVEVSNRMIGQNKSLTLNSPTHVASNTMLSHISLRQACEVRVLDSNIDAEYGDFTGGVIAAKSCTPTSKVGKIHGQIFTDFTEDSWVKFNSNSQDDSNNPVDNDRTPRFRNLGISTSLSSQITEQLGLNLQYSERESRIYRTTTFENSPQQIEKRENQRLALQTFYKPNALTELNTQVNHTESRSLNFIDHYKNNGLDTTNQMTSISNELNTQLRQALLSQRLNLQYSELERDASAQAFIPWRWSTDKSWSDAAVSNEGSLGDLNYTQYAMHYQAKLSFLPWQHQWFEQQLNTGWGLKYNHTTWERPEDSYVFFLPRLPTSDLTSCTNYTGKTDAYCDLSFESRGFNGQFHQQRYLHRADRLKEHQVQAHAFFSSFLKFSPQLQATVGLRADYDHLTENLNLAPRVHVELQPSEQIKTAYTIGYNRYYDASLFEHYLQYRVHQLSELQARQSLQTAWQFTGNANLLPMQLGTLKNPYSDEWVLGLTQPFKQLNLGLKWVNRNYRDQIQLLKSNQEEMYYYSNAGRSAADILSLTFGHSDPFQLFGAEHQIHFGADYTKIARNFDHYADIVLPNQDYMVYEGKVIAKVDRPASNYNQPWTIRLNWDMQFDSLPLKIHHFLRYRSPMQARYVTDLAYDEQFEYRGQWVYEQVKEQDIGSRFNWDIQANYPLIQHKQYGLYLGLNVFNVTHRKNDYYDADNFIVSQEMGRQFVMNLRLDF